MIKSIMNPVRKKTGNSNMDRKKKNSKEMRVVFFGGRHVKSILLSLKINFDLTLAVSTDKSLVTYAMSQKTPFAQVLAIDKLLVDGIKKLEPDLGIVADFGLKIPNSLIKAFPNGIINIHPSTLPKFRGPTPVPSAILSDEKSTGITFIKLDDLIDHGPIIYQEKHQISPADFSDKLYSHLFKRSGEILPFVVKKYISGEIKPIAQDHKNATYTKKFEKRDGEINVNRPPSKEKLDRMIRAFDPWPGVFAKYKLTDSVVVIKLLPGKKIQVEGKNSMTYKDFINGYPKGKIFLEKLSLISKS